MPRTKAVKKKPASKTTQTLFPWIENNRKIALSNLDEANSNYLSELRIKLTQSKLTLPVNLLSKTIRELKEHPLNWSGNNTCMSVQVLEDTQNMTINKRKPVVRSSSFADDEGYLTAESSKSTSGGRMSRARSRLQKTSRLSKSLPRPKRTAASTDRYKTPAGRVPPVSYGTVTPKVKPNTPQVLLRRPKQGEMVLSLQGSPLLTGAVVADNVANINIPLDDGRLLSIQPQRGLRISQIPSLDLETKRQLETLRDNLNKVCALSCKR